MSQVEDLSGRKLGEFVLRARIGEGGFGAVYRCEQPLLGREAVVKVLHPRLRHNGVVLQRFLREARLASQLDHPGAAHIYAFGIERDDGLFWIAMEMVQGVGLNRWLREHGPMPLDRFVPFFEQLAEVVQAAHERGIVHRDLKPSNVMVIERAGRLTPKLLDFGVAKLVEGAPALRAAQAIPGDSGEQAAATRVAGSNRMPGSEETVSQTASTPHANGRDLRRLTDVASRVGSPPYMSPEQWTNPADVGPSSDLYSLGVLGYEAITGRRPFHAATSLEYAELHCGASVPPVGAGLPPALDRFFDRALAKRPEQRWKTALELAAALRAEWVATRVGSAALSGEETSEAGVGGDDEVAPYLGLAPYVAGDAERFVGREAEVAAFLERLRTRSLHVVVGPPGTGKSSFVHAGVIPGLPPGWRAVSLRPGAAPLAALAFRLEAAGVAGDDLRALLATSPGDVAARVADAAGTGAIVVVIDQLEELFTLGVSAEEREQFAAAVVQLAASADLPIRVIATIRDDYLMQLHALRPLRPLLSSAVVLLGNPLHDDLVRVVVEPARRAGYTLSDPELAHDMVRAAASRPGALALLSFAALRLWELRDRTLRQLTRSAYDAMDGIAGALVRHAENTFEALSADEQRLTREIFRQLVTADGARAPLSVDELHQRLAALRSEEVLDKLIAVRLIATSEAEPDANGARQTQVEVIHDALLEAWPRLRRWIREDIDGVRMREQLRVAARQWSDRGRPRGQLWRGDALVDLQRWLRQPKAAQLSEREVAFVEASRRLARLGHVRLGLVAIGFAIAIAVFVYYTLRSRVAQHVGEERLIQVYADWGQEALLDGRSTEALVYLDVAARRGETSPRVNFMLARAAQPFEHQVAELASAHGRMWWASYSHDGRRIVTTNDDGAQVWDAGRMQLEFTMHHGAITYQAEFTPDDGRIATAGADGAVDVWDAHTGRLIWSLRHASPGEEVPPYFALAMSPDGTLIAATDITGAIVDVWDLRTGEFVHQLVHASPMRVPSLAFSSDGAWIATTAGDEARVYDTKHWASVLTIAGPGIGTLSFDPTGPRLATGSLRGDVSIWAIPGGMRVQHLRDTGGKIHHVAFSPDGAFVVAAAQDGVDRIWNARSGELHAELMNHRSASLWAEFDSTSHLVVSTDGNGEVVISDIALRMTVSTLRGPEMFIRAPHFDPRSQHVIGASWDGTARVWDTARAYLRWVTESPGGQCSRTLRADIDRRFIAVACADHGTRIWDTHDASHARLLAELPTPTLVRGDFFPDPAVNADGDRAAVAIGNMVTVYELPGGRVVTTVQHAAPVTAIAFAAAGRDLVTGSADGSLRLTRDDGEQRELTRLPAGIDVAEFLADGRIVVADARPRLGLYDVVRRAPIAERDLPARVLAVRASSDARRVLAIPITGNVSPLVLWDLVHPERSRQLETSKAPVLSARFVLGNTKILTASGDGTARLWDAETGRHQKSYLTSSFLADVDLDPSGTMVLTAGGDGALRFWDASSGHMLWNLQAHHAAVVGVHFDGTSIVTRSLTGEVARWELPPLQKLGLTVERIVRCLPIRFDGEIGGLVEQDPRCGT